MKDSEGSENAAASVLDVEKFVAGGLLGYLEDVDVGEVGVPTLTGGL